MNFTIPSHDNCIFDKLNCMATINQSLNSRDVIQVYSKSTRISFFVFNILKNIGHALADNLSKFLISLFADFYIPLKH